MRNFHNILYASTGLGNDIEGLKQALSLARNNGVDLTYLLLVPELPASQHAYRDRFLAFLNQEAQKALESARAALNMGDDAPKVTMITEGGETPPAVSIIRQVLRREHDLLIKEAEPLEESHGFMAMDMTLLRKCPCPVWLARPISRPRHEIRVAVAVNPESRDQPERDLSIRLLELARSLADDCSGELDICSCWDFEFERYLRGSSRADIPDRNIHGAVDYAQAAHNTELNNLIHASAIGGVIHLHRLKGRAEDRIPSFVRGRGVDILVMGSVARSGIAGFFMGNTAENIMRELNCALVALKPKGFVSPVNAY